MDFWEFHKKELPFFRLACISLRESVHSRMANYHICPAFCF